MNVTPSQREFDLAHKVRFARLWEPKPQTSEEWFASAWQMLDGVLIRYSIREVQEAVCKHFKVPLIYMESSRRTHSHYIPRAAAIFLCHRLTGKSSSVIGRGFGNRDHTTILHNIAAVEKMIELGHPVRGHIRTISKKLGAYS